MTPLRSSGRLLLEKVDLPKYAPYLAEAMNLQLRQGKVGADAHHSFAFGGGERRVTLEDATLRLDGLDAGGEGQASALSLPTLVASGVNADLLANKVRIGKLEARGGAVSVILDPAGELNFAKLFGPPPGAKPKPKDPKAKPLDVTLDALALSNFGLTYEDRSRVRPVKVEAKALGLTLQGAADPALDGGALRRAAFEAKLRAKAWALEGKGGAPDGAFQPTLGQRDAALRALHAAALPPDPKAPKAFEPPLPEMEARLLGMEKDDPEALRQLAEARADAVQQALLALKAPEDRVFPVKGTLKGDQAKAAKVWFAVR